MGGKSKPEIVRLRELKQRRETVKQRLTELGWTQAELAVHLDRRESTISDWLRNKGDTEIPKEAVLYLNLLVRFKGKRIRDDGDEADD